jgi:2-hydroxy-6-oxonona-2,4-dienedioate hydrolase
MGVKRRNDVSLTIVCNRYNYQQFLSICITLQRELATVNGTKIGYSCSDARRAVAVQPAKIIDSEASAGDILFIHGLGSSADRWLDIPDALSLAGFRTFAIDLPGFGVNQARTEIEYSVDYLADMTLGFIHSLGMRPEKTTLVGHSLGGFIAARLASKHVAHRLVLIDSSGLLERATPLLESYFAAAMNPSADSVREVFEQMVADPIRIPDALVQGFIYGILQPNAKHAFSTAYKSSTSTQLTRSELKSLEEIGNSILIIWGEKDRLIPHEYFIRFARHLPLATTAQVADAGHAPFAEKPALLFELISSFVRS